MKKRAIIIGLALATSCVGCTNVLKPEDVTCIETLVIIARNQHGDSLGVVATYCSRIQMIDDTTKTWTYDFQNGRWVRDAS